jgi:hypothetical protein
MLNWPKFNKAPDEPALRKLIWGGQHINGAMVRLGFNIMILM